MADAQLLSLSSQIAQSGGRRAQSYRLLRSTSDSPARPPGWSAGARNAIGRAWTSRGDAVHKL
jgi:hypothetical protein